MTPEADLYEPRGIFEPKGSYELSKTSFEELEKALNASKEDIQDRQRVYRPLLSHSEEFRLAVLLPSTDPSSTIECRLVHTTLNGSNSFEALSYVWGKPEFKQEILLDGVPFHITCGLETALLQLRYPDRERTLWVDAICIDQANIRERGEQVGLMRGIYSSCTANLFWLGVADDKIKRGMRIVEDLEGFDISKLRGLGWKEYGGETSHLSTWWTTTPDDWRALEKLFNHPQIWGRVWAVQEISCAPKVVLVSGHSVLEWDLVEGILGSHDHFTDAFHSPFSHDWGNMTSRIFAKAQIVKTQRKIFREMREGGPSSMLDVLARFRLTKSTDPRDKIYALLGLVSDRLGIEVDYRKSTRDVFVGVAESIINSSANLDIVC